MNIERLSERAVRIECDMCKGSHVLQSVTGEPATEDHFGLVGEADTEQVLCAGCKHMLPQAVVLLQTQGQKVKTVEIRPLTRDRLPPPPKVAVGCCGGEDAEPTATSE